MSSVLGNIDTTVKEMDYMLNPLQKVINISLKDGIKNFISSLDIILLNEKTQHSDVDDFLHLFNINSYILYDDDIKKYILKVLWYICNYIIYRDISDVRVLNKEFSKFFKDKNITNIKFYIFFYKVINGAYNYITINDIDNNVILSFSFINTDKDIKND